MIEDKATEKLKKRLKDMGMIVNMGADKAQPRQSKSSGTDDKVNVKKKGAKK